MLQIENENISTYQASVLYLSVIVEKKSKTQLFNKRDVLKYEPTNSVYLQSL